ncbi:inactive serine/threonine-protein kinase VRK3 isoform X1 [Oryzias melastigma]|uniref:VRK serine/threonine kinase 3 n=1 Tax=Oryzias melastigma TaxID=30732 RepID=A0A3B3B8U8_ORYME|nr:inactive serine/threonine-protein kinase VRK3 isoform X1 [Oryzias melastigma]XP_024151325.1 inactive serine/threonine-protein kinase VRK3 isoform X1 [Oryzias melastigma]XP_024151326.1 inactive serine/threonine-protein kinase VRK3 isoform X1 [Oryzias melastigma]
MPFHFCPQCGTKLQPGYRFCPSCGEKLPCAAEDSGPVSSTAPTKRDVETSTTKTNVAVGISCKPTENKVHEDITSMKVSPRPPLRKTRKSLRLDKDPAPLVVPSTQPAIGEETATVKTKVEFEPTVDVSPSGGKSTRTVKGKAKISSPPKRQAEEPPNLCDKGSGVTQEPAVDAASPVSSPITKSPFKGRSKTKRAKHTVAVEPLQDCEEVTDMTGKKWKLQKLLSQSAAELLYEVTRPNSKEPHILKLGAKDGKIFNEQNFLQRAAKPASVDKWIKQNKLDFLGIPSCSGFGLHADSYRFLIFPNMGRSLHSVIEKESKPLPEKVVLQLACRILDVLQFIHSNEYVHADINAENIYIKPGQDAQVYLVGYCHAFRYCPGGQHVEYREASRTPHEGALPFISVDAHKGAGPSRRSDLQSLGYCMLHWHTEKLPWLELAQPDQVAVQKQRYRENVDALLSHCFGKKRVSSAFQTYLKSVMALEYSEEPDYSSLKNGLRAALHQLGGSVEAPLSF